MFTEAEMSARIDRGMKYLDDNYPGWEKKINLDKLSMSGNCVCRQLGIENLPEVSDDPNNGCAHTLDFDVGLGFFTGHKFDTVKHDKMWKERIKQRLGVKTVYEHPQQHGWHTCVNSDGNMVMVYITIFDYHMTMIHYHACTASPGFTEYRRFRDEPGQVWKWKEASGTFTNFSLVY